MKKVLSLFILLSFSSFTWSESPPLSLLDLTKIRQVVSLAMSPDGEHIAFTLTRPRDVYSNGDGESWRELYLISRRGNITPFITGPNAIGQIQWSKDSEKIWMLAKRAGDKYVGVYVISLQGGESRKVVTHNHDVVGFSVDEEQKKLVFWGAENALSKQHTLHKKGFDAEVYNESSKTNKLWLVELNKQGAPLKLLYEQSHVLAVQFQPQGNLIAIQHAPTALLDDITMRKSLGLMNLDGKLTRQFDHQGKMGKFKWSPDGQHLALIGTNDPNDPAEGRLLLAQINKSSLVNLIPDLKGHVEDIDWLSESKVGFILHTGLQTLLASKRLKPSSNFKKLETKIHKITKFSASQGGKQVALVSSSAKHANEVFWHNERGTKRVTDSNPWLAKRTLGRQKAVSFFARDGMKIEGMLVSPAEKSDSPRPLIIFVHGGPETHVSDGWLNRYSHPAHVAAGKGYISYFPNYRGSTGRGVKFSKAGQKDYAGAEFNDILDAKFHLVKMGLADPERVGITGASYGGYASAWAATVFSEHFAASVATMAIGNQISKFGTTDIPTEMRQLHSLLWPWQDWQWMLERSPIFHADKLNTPLLLMHGEQDSRVHPSQSIELYRYAKLQGKAPVRLVLYPEEGHGFRHATSKLDYSMRLMRWMDTYLLQKQTSLPPYALPHDDLPMDEEFVD